MHLSAILVTGNRSSFPATMDSAHGQRHEPAPVSLACVEIFGQSVLERTVARLRKAGARTISVIAGSRFTSFPRDAKLTIVEDLRDRWCAAERTLKKHTRQGIETVLIAELGAYVELNLAAVLQFHTIKGQPITPLHDSHGPLGWWIVDAARVTSARDFSLPFNEDETVSRPAPYLVEQHVNRLADARDFRRLVLDAFLGHCSITPTGREIKPGVWIDEGARLHKTARLVAPAYLGRNTRVQSAAVITRFSNLERDCHLGEGSVVANSSVLPHTAIGRGLDVSAALVEGSEFFDLRRNITLKIEDPNLISDAAPQRWHAPSPGREHEELERPAQQPELEYSPYLSRAAGGRFEVSKGEV